MYPLHVVWNIGVYTGISRLRTPDAPADQPGQHIVRVWLHLGLNLKYNRVSWNNGIKLGMYQIYFYLVFIWYYLLEFSKNS